MLHNMHMSQGAEVLSWFICNLETGTYAVRTTLGVILHGYRLDVCLLSFLIL
jgi:hypothetical protein